MKSLPTAPDAPRTPAELAREKRLRDDPLAVVHGPLFVSCKRCGNRIKLSPKSSYDPFHWMKHRERCLRKPIGSPRATRPSPKSLVSRRPPWPLNVADTDEYMSLAKKSPASSSNGDNVTPPPLTPDDDRPPTDLFRPRSPSPIIDLPVVPLVDRWQTWNWSELRPPIFTADQDCKLGFVPLEDWDDDYRTASRLSA